MYYLLPFLLLTSFLSNCYALLLSTSIAFTEATSPSPHLPQNNGPIQSRYQPFDRITTLLENICNPAYDTCISRALSEITASPTSLATTSSSPSEILPTPGTNRDEFIRGIIAKSQKEAQKEELQLRRSRTGSTALTVPFLDVSKNPFVQDLHGCTSVLIISEKGLWLSHFWQEPAMWTENDEVFQELVIDAIEKGDGTYMPSPLPLGAPGEILGPGTNVEILIFCLEEAGTLLYSNRLDQIEETLVGPGRPWEGVAVKRHGYIKQSPDNLTARGTVLIQYGPNQIGDTVSPPDQMAMWIVYLEGSFISERKWKSFSNQRVITANPEMRYSPTLRAVDEDKLDVFAGLCDGPNAHHEECKGRTIRDSLRIFPSTTSSIFQSESEAAPCTSSLVLSNAHPTVYSAFQRHSYGGWSSRNDFSSIRDEGDLYASILAIDEPSIGTSIPTNRPNLGWLPFSTAMLDRYLR